MKNFKRYNKFKQLVRSSYENYLSQCQDRITHLEDQVNLMGAIIKHYEAIMKVSNIDFVQINAIYNDLIYNKEKNNEKK